MVRTNSNYYGGLRSQSQLSADNFKIHHEPEPLKPKDFLKNLNDKLKATTDDVLRANIVKDALDTFKTDSIMSHSIMETGLNAIKDSGKAAFMGAMMQDHGNIVMDMKSNLLDVRGSDLTHVAPKLLQQIPWNHLPSLDGVELPANLDLSQNAHMNGVNLQGLSARNLTLPANVRDVKAQGAEDIHQDNASVSTFNLTKMGGATGWIPPSLGNNSDAPIVTSKGNQLDHARLGDSKWSNVPGVIGAPTPLAPPA